jgi:hypothetical protein
MGYDRRWAVETASSTYKRLRRTHHLKKHRNRAEDKSIHIQHTNKHTHEIRKDKQKKKTER